jgi:hypothetical protein
LIETLFSIIICALTVALLTGRCANVAQGPESGPKDSIPPVLLTTIPDYLAVNQNPQRIKIVFNEYLVQIKDASKSLTVSPPSLRRPATAVQCALGARE